MIVTDAAVRDGLLRDPHIRKTLEVARSADISLEGQVVPLELNERIVGLDFREIKMIPLPVEVSWGVQKALANIGAARSGLVNVLITDEDTAHEMLSVMENGISPTRDAARTT